jgi:hypothetical protein
LRLAGACCANAPGAASTVTLAAVESSSEAFERFIWNFPPRRPARMAGECFSEFISKFSIWVNFSFGTIFLMKQLLRVFGCRIRARAGGDRRHGR